LQLLGKTVSNKIQWPRIQLPCELNISK